MAKYTGTGIVSDSDYKAIKWVGVDKVGKGVTITIDNAINMGNIDWTVKEKDDVVAEVVYTGVYDNTDATSTSTAEPWSVEYTDGTTASTNIILGAGIFYIGTTAVALSRGGGKFSVEREFRAINADGDRGYVKGRIVMDASTPKLTLNTLQILGRLTDLYAGLAIATTT